MPRADLRKQVAKNIKKARIKKGFTQEKAAELIGLHYKYYQKVESGSVNLTLDSLDKISHKLKVEIKNLFSS